MGNISKKRIVLTAILSCIVLLLTTVIQFLYGKSVDYGFFIFGKSCTLTGYPIARCVPDSLISQIFLFMFINFLFWFMLLNLFWGWFNNTKK